MVNYLSVSKLDVHTQNPDTAKYRTFKISKWKTKWKKFTYQNIHTFFSNSFKFSAFLKKKVGILRTRRYRHQGKDQVQQFISHKTHQYVISRAGHNIWADHDEFHFMETHEGVIFILYTRARQFVGPKGVWRTCPQEEVGWMVRKFGWGCSSC